MMWNPCPQTPNPGLFAQAVLDAESIIVAIALIVMIIAGGYGVVWIKRRGQQELDKPTLHDQLSSYERLQNEGLLEPQELERIKIRLATKAHEGLHQQSPAPSSPPVQPPDTPWSIPPADRGGPSHG